MALIYASAVNKRMHQLQKKRSMDIPTQTELSGQPVSFQCSTKSRCNQQLEELSNARSISRDCSGEARKHSAPPSSNRSCAVYAEKSQIVKLSSMDGGGTKQWRKLTVPSGQFNGDNENGGTADVALPCRKISMPQTTTTMPTMIMLRGGTALDRAGGLATAHAEVARTKRLIRAKKTSNNSTSPSHDECDDDDDEEDGGDEQAGKNGVRILDHFTSAFRRRSVSMDERVLRRRRARYGTLSSSDSLGSPTGDDVGDGIGTRKLSAFRKMRERLNKWKLST
uniref:Uncharacterized protein n=1 Tax=Globodera rostochiensis TaxID=31243 RepID=A0A914HKG0_GLORO